MLKQVFALILLISLFRILPAQMLTYPLEGVHSSESLPIALTWITLIPEPGVIIENATLLMHKGKIISAGKGLQIPSGYRVIDMKGAWVYPGLIDIWVPQTAQGNSGVGCWNESVHPEHTVIITEGDSTFIRKKEAFRQAGFTNIMLIPNRGIVRGSGTLLHCGNQAPGAEVIQSRFGLYFSFDSNKRREGYPASLMGTIALLRQTFLDAAWYRSVLATGDTPGEKNDCLATINVALDSKSPLFFQASTSNDPARILALGSEAGVSFIIRGTGREYERTAKGELKKASFILPLNYPLPPDVKNPEIEQTTGLYALRHWAWAPSNPNSVHTAGNPFVFTSDGLKRPAEWRMQVIRSIERGLPQQNALAALTTVPAQWLGMQGKLGCIKAGAFANLCVFSGNIFDPESYLMETWVQGQVFPTELRPNEIPSGTYSLNLPGKNYDSLYISFNENKIKAEIITQGKSPVPVQAQFKAGLWNLNFNSGTEAGMIYLSAVCSGDSLKGTGRDAIESYYSWYAVRSGDVLSKPKEYNPDTLSPPELRYPNRAWGRKDAPTAQVWHIKNVSLWTNLENADLEKKWGIKADQPGGFILQGELIISGGKILKMGRNLAAAPGEIVIDGMGKHLSPGIIDEHSHIAIERGVNEGTQAITAEVRIGDVIRPEDLNIFRQLAGGVTTSQLLHGSANPIGGQSAIIKLKWGAGADEMIMKEAPPFIKFALGENVKQSNWGEKYTQRFPQSRPGVEQIMEDAFIRALEYKKEKASASGKAFRKDLELETLVEILEGKRFITCHSYVQSEITMLIRLAEKYNFRINTFTHVLEGYKITDKIQKHGASASTFSDWWAYKYEVIDAIPYNAALLTRAGINTGFNSDDGEMGRRLNQEAAKAVKYGELDDTEALKLVTLNPAKMLRIDKWVGSLEPGKQADLVLWSGHPLSNYSHAEKTWIDGRLYFDIEQLEHQQTLMNKEKSWLTKKALEAGKNGSDSKPEEATDPEYHCETIESYTDEEIH